MLPEVPISIGLWSWLAKSRRFCVNDAATALAILIINNNEEGDDDGLLGTLFKVFCSELCG